MNQLYIAIMLTAAEGLDGKELYDMWERVSEYCAGPKGLVGAYLVEYHNVYGDKMRYYVGVR